MSDTDGFIEEVTEEVRKDQLFGYLKKYGWIAGAVIVLAVGGAAYSEWNKSKVDAAAQARGDAMIAALENPDPAQQITALNAIDNDAGAARLILSFQKAAILAEDGQKEAALSILDGIAQFAENPSIYRDMASFKALTLRGKDMDQAARLEALEALTAPGNTFRALAMEQIAVAKLDGGDAKGAIDQLTEVLNEPALSNGMQQRVLQLLISLGGEVPVQSQLLSDN